MEQRELDFRAWCIPESKYYHYVEIYAYKDGSCGWSAGENNNHPVGRSDQFIIEQWTNNKDCKGKRIYDGDLITIGKSKTVYQVKWKNDGWLGVSKEGDDWGAYTTRVYPNSEYDKKNNYITVIGNIHESSEGAKTNL
jgi:hypothetical protein